MRSLIIAFIFFFSAVSISHAQNLPLGPRDIYLRGDITEDKAIAVSNTLKLLNLISQEEITIHITSFGGDVLAGLQIYDDMQESASPIRTICEGYCMSMAAIILTSGNRRESQASATIMFHQVSTEIRGKISTLIEDLSEAERLQGIIDDHIHEHTGLSLDAIHKMESFDHYMSPKEAKSLGIIDKIRGKNGK